MDVATRGATRKVTILSSSAARVRITGSTFAGPATGVISTAGAVLVGAGFTGGTGRADCANKTAGKQSIQMHAIGCRILSPSFAPQLGAILLGNSLHVAVNLF